MHTPSGHTQWLIADMRWKPGWTKAQLAITLAQRHKTIDFLCIFANEYDLHCRYTCSNGVRTCGKLVDKLAVVWHFYTWTPSEMLTVPRSRSLLARGVVAYVSVKRDVRALSFELWKSVTPSGIGCICKYRFIHIMNPMGNAHICYHFMAMVLYKNTKTGQE